ncbi:DUF1996 domain-containing protein [Kineosporia babensis]|uniref:DUF1996 domain-containing protein n=1 Tax=Kineosporia babensis TaxID=499548 RepID=A0A9X1NEB1_9ACTN|nr:DUF1996 domain-containing protein [Kineosporia babensis]
MYRPRLLRPAIALATASVLGVTAAIALGVGPGASAQLPKNSHHSVAGTPTMPGHTIAPDGSMTVPAGDWLPVDQAAWQAQLAEFEALKPRTPPATAKKNPEFNATCTYSHSGKNDPIVFPGQSGASHLHSFMGNAVTDANTDTDDLMQSATTTCQPVEDHSAYWIPTLTDKSTGKEVEPKEMIVYYGSLLEDKTRTVPMPNGMRMLVGDAKKQTPTPAGAQNQFWCAGGPVDGTTRSDDGNWPVCQDDAALHFLMRFPDCWDGQNLDSPDHKSHVSYGAAGTCPEEFPVRIPAVTFVINYDTEGTKAGFELASGMPSSMHGDAFFAWDTKTMADLVKSCVNQLVTCNKEKQF